MSNSVTPWTITRQTPRVFPGKNTGMGCHLAGAHNLVCKLDSILALHVKYKVDQVSRNTKIDNFTLECEFSAVITLASVCQMGFPGGSVAKNPPTNAGDAGSIPRSERSPGEENGNSFHYSCLGNPMDREVWQTTVHGVTKKLDMTWHLNKNNLSNMDQ